MGNDLWEKITCLVSGQLSSGRQPRLKLTGEPPSNDAEELVKKIAGDRKELPLEWLETKVCHELYAKELRLTRYTADIGICGREHFRREAKLILARIHREFGFIDESGGANPAGEDNPR
jgi:hypothetical protein